MFLSFTACLCRKRNSLTFCSVPVLFLLYALHNMRHCKSQQSLPGQNKHNTKASYVGELLNIVPCPSSSTNNGIATQKLTSCFCDAACALSLGLQLLFLGFPQPRRNVYLHTGTHTQLHQCLRTRGILHHYSQRGRASLWQPNASRALGTRWTGQYQIPRGADKAASNSLGCSVYNQQAGKWRWLRTVLNPTLPTLHFISLGCALVSSVCDSDHAVQALCLNIAAARTNWAACILLLMHKSLHFLKTESQRWESNNFFLADSHSLSSLLIISLSQLLLDSKSLCCWKEQLWQRNVHEVGSCFEICRCCFF